MKKEFKHLLYRTLYLVKQKLLKSQSEKLCYSIKRKVFNLASGILERKRRLLKMKQFHGSFQLFLFLKESSSEQMDRSSIITAHTGYLKFWENSSVFFLQGLDSITALSNTLPKPWSPKEHSNAYEFTSQAPGSKLLT